MGSMITRKTKTGQYAWNSDTSHLLKEDWEPWAEREARLRRESEKNGETFQPENDWGMADRQAEDRVRAEENSAKRQRRDSAAQGKNYQGDYPDPAIVISTTRRWGGNQSRREGKKKETDRTKYIRRQLAESEKNG